MDPDNDMKDKILKEVARCVKVIFVRSSSAGDTPTPLTIDCQLILSINHVFEYALLNNARGYWPLVSSCSHSQTVQTVNRLVGTQVPVSLKGQAWILATLVEGSLPSYLQCFLADTDSIDRAYAPHSVMRDSASASQFCSLLRGLESIPFKATINIGQGDETNSSLITRDACSGFRKPAINLALEGLLNPAHTSTMMTSSMTSSLASPEDSGFTQLDSETDTASFSEIILEGDSSYIKEDGAHFLSCSAGHTGLPDFEHPQQMTTSDIANGNTSSIMDSRLERHEEIVYRKPKHSKRKSNPSKQQKRVSFHDCAEPCNAENVAEVSKSQTAQYDCAPSKTKNFFESLKIASPNLSFAINGVPTSAHGLDGVEIGKDTSMLCGDGLTQDFYDENSVMFPRTSNSFHCEQYSKQNESGSIIQAIKTRLFMTSQTEKHCKMWEERGMPEGQEDPPQRCPQHLGSTKFCGTEFSVDESGDFLLPRNSPSPVPSCSSLRPQYDSPRHRPGKTTAFSGVVIPSSVLNQAPSKACLVKRFLRSVTEKKLANYHQSASSSSALMRVERKMKVNLYIPGVQPVHKLSQEILFELEEEIARAQMHSSASDLTDTKSQSGDFSDPALYAHLLSSKYEVIYKIIKCQSSVSNSAGRRTSLYAVLTDQALHVCDKKFLKQISVQLKNISLALVGPSSQWVMLKMIDSSSVVLVTAGVDAASSLLGGIEYTLRRKRPALPDLPAIFQLSLSDFSLLSPWHAIVQGEHVHHYSVVHTTEGSSGPPLSLLKSTKEGHFMYRFKVNQGADAWKPGFFVLKNGILYVFSDEGKVIPPYMLNLKGVYCSLVYIASRPHTIEVGSLQIAAPDDYVACDWLEAIQNCSSNINNGRENEFSVNIVSGSLLVTDSRLLLISGPGTDLKVTSQAPLLAGFLSDIVSLSVGADGCCWCVVELSCREVRESGGDNILFFNTQESFLSFFDVLWKLNSDLRKVIHVLAENDSLRHQCDRAASVLQLES